MINITTYAAFDQDLCFALHLLPLFFTHITRTSSYTKTSISMNILRRRRNRSRVDYLYTSIILGIALILSLSYIYVNHQSQRLTTQMAPTSKAKEIAKDMRDSLFSKDWKPVYVYQGEKYKKELPSRPWNGQVEQDKLIAWLTKNKTQGYFIDLAANDPVHWSNTLGLERLLNWTGLCIEANPAYWHRLSTLRSCTVIGAVVGKNADEAIEFTMDEHMGGIVDGSFDNKKSDLSKSAKRFTADLARTFEQFKVPPIIDYLSLDVEGAEEYIMNSFPYSNYRFRFLTVERPSDPLIAKLKDNGYNLVKKLVFFGDTLFAHESEPSVDTIIQRYCTESNGMYCTEKRTRIPDYSAV